MSFDILNESRCLYLLESKIKRVLPWQLLFTAAIAALLATKHDPVINIVYCIISILAYGLLKKGSKNWSQVCNILVVPYAFIHVYVELFKLLLNLSTDLAPLFFLLYFATMLLSLIPITINDYGNIQKPIFRLLASIWVIINLFLAPQLSIHNGSFLTRLNKSQILLAMMFAVYGYLVITSWGYKLYLNTRGAS